MFVLTKYTYNVNGKIIDAEPEAIFTTRDAIMSELKDIEESYKNNDRKPIVVWNASSLSVKFLDGLKREFLFQASEIGVKA